MKDLMKACYHIKKGFALIVTNENFDKDLHVHDLPGVRVDEENIRKFCRKAGFTIYSATKTNDLTFLEMTNLFYKSIPDEKFEDHDAFICFISSHGNGQGILGIDGSAISFKVIVDAIVKIERFRNSPKLFFLNCCRGSNVNIGFQSSDEYPTHFSGHPANDLTSLAVSMPFYANTIIAYSCWEEFKSYINKKEGSWFISALTDVLNNYGKTEQLTDMLTMVNYLLCKKGKLGKKQMPCFTCSLLQPVKFTFPE